VAKENELHELLQHNTKIELKADRMWMNTGNIAIETECRGKESGISTTEAKWFSIALTHNNTALGFFLFRSDILRKRLEKMISQKDIKYVMGGDGKRSKLYLIPLKKLIFLMIPPNLDSLGWFEKNNSI
jgi:hypothetical protein